MTPFLTILAINAICVGVAYGLVYPRLRPLMVRRMMGADLVMTAIALGAAAYLFWGRGLPFSLGPVPLRWWGASLLTLAAVEIPVFVAFCRFHGLSLTDPDAPPRYPPR